jgi:FtsP/CotA-like multicopper oxidase with cupredoxin domain
MGRSFGEDGAQEQKDGGKSRCGQSGAEPGTRHDNANSPAVHNAAGATGYQIANAGPRLASRNGAPFPMILTRRAIVVSSLMASLWTSSHNGTAHAEPSKNPLAADRIEKRLAAPPAPATPALGYEGTSPGPVLRARVGDRLTIGFHNALDEPTSLAFPGLRAPRALLAFGTLGDAALAPGATRDVTILTSEPGFQIYGALLGADPKLQMARGLYGPLVVDELSPPEIDLEAIVLVADWRLDAQAAIADLADPAPGRTAGRMGTLMTAGGEPTPFQLSGRPGGRVRLRLANAATARILYLSIDGLKPVVVAVDGQPSAVFAPLHNLLPVGPGARFELMFDLPRDPGAIVRFYMRPDDTRSDARDEELLVFSTVGAPAPERQPIDGLPDNPGLPAEIALERALRADIVIAGGDKAALTINGASAPTRPLFSAPRNAPVALAFANKTAWPQTLRITGHVARLLHNLDDGWDPYWRDIFIVPAGKTIHAAFVADNPGLWPLEATAPERRNAGLMAVFEVK